MSNPIPSQIALTPIVNGAPADGSVVQGNDAAIQAAVNGLIAALSNGTAGKFLQAVDSSDVVWASNKAPTQQVFSSGSGTYTTPAGCVGIFVECIGAGGGGGGCSSTTAGQTSSGGSGGGGGFASVMIQNPSATYAYAVGAPGAGGPGGAGSGSVGGNATATTFGTSCEVTGGLGGSGGAVNTGGASGGPGVGTVGTVLITGGGNGNDSLGVAARGGAGGIATQNADGTAGVFPGGGGGGGFSANGASHSGASGANGLIVVTEYY